MTEYKTTQKKIQGHSFQEKYSHQNFNVTSQLDMEQAPTKQELADDEQVNVMDGLFRGVNKEKQTCQHMEPHEDTIEEEWRITRNIELTQGAKHYFPIIQKNYKEVSDQLHS